MPLYECEVKRNARHNRRCVSDMPDGLGPTMRVRLQRTFLTKLSAQILKGITFALYFPRIFHVLPEIKRKRIKRRGEI